MMKYKYMAYFVVVCLTTYFNDSDYVALDEGVMSW